MENRDAPPAYNELSSPSTQVATGGLTAQLTSQQLHSQASSNQLREQVNSQIPVGPAQVNSTYIAAQTYQPFPQGPTQPPLYPPFTQQPTTSCVVIHTTTKNQVPVGRDPTFVRCPSCQSDVVTTIQTKPTTRTHAFALGLCFIGCWLCCCIPYCMDSCKSANHYCPVCNAFVGSRRD
ncbi:lipopolysaccharide-induced tumor necrosis factor-alpha factor homolog [Drosophila nasuta]|uniref:lipopolysaccharide-induced tumor necrosis factor-alpha factor homolog n=1 Tax=Drosophila nasuta TaxID=42062 RepID=UPI00295E281A|nr:lipopolysaccharide-induced tumor necrosis factor-alpha factor homolog [Drosophila nasuta]